MGPNQSDSTNEAQPVLRPGRPRTWGLLKALATLVIVGVLGSGIVAASRVAQERQRVRWQALEWDARANLAANKGDWKQARVGYEKSVANNPKNATSRNNLAWLLATCPDEEARDGALSVEHALEACRLTGYENAMFIDTLAAAYAEAGDFGQAVEFQQRAVEMVPSAARAEFTARLRLFEAGRPFRNLRWR